MQLQIRGKDLHITDGMREAAERRASRLDRLVERINEAKLEPRVDKRRVGNEVVAQFTLQSGKTLLRAEERHEDAERSIDLVMDKMERRARRLHERNNDHRTGKTLPLDVSQDGSEEDEASESAIARTKRFHVKPMNTEEASEQMALLGHDFFLFQNSETSSISLVYRRLDGQLGLLIPEVG